MKTPIAVRWLVAILFMAFVVRVVAAVVWQERLGEAAFAFPDSESYWELGRRIAGGDTYEFSESRAFRTPGYPALLAPLFWVFGDRPPVVAARIVGAVLGTFAVGAVAWLARKLFNNRAMLIAALCGAVYLEAIAMSILVLSEALFAPLMVAQFVLWTITWNAREKKTVWVWSIATGFCAGLAVLVRPSWLLFTPLALAVSFLFGRQQALRPALSILAALLVTLSPWWMRNVMVLHAVVPTSSETGPSLYDGLHPGATGASDMRFVPIIEKQFDQQHPELAQHPAAREVALNRHFTSEALLWAKQNPQRVAELAAIKLGRMWNLWPNEASLRAWPLRLAIAAGYVPLLVLGGIGAWQFGRRDFPYALCLLPAVYFSLLHMIFVGSIRYRGPAMLVLIVLAAGALDWLWQKFGTTLLTATQRGARVGD